MTEPSIERLADELEIGNLIARLAHLADMAEDLDDYVACFTEDAVWDFPGNEHESISPARTEGRQAIRADRLARRARGVQGPGTRTRHVITTIAVRVHDDGTAEADSYFLFMADTTGDPRIRNLGHYSDRFVHSDGGWELAFRRITTG